MQIKLVVVVVVIGVVTYEDSTTGSKVRAEAHGNYNQLKVIYLVGKCYSKGGSDSALRL